MSTAPAPIPEQVLASRGWTQVAVDRLGLGWDGQRVLIPVRDRTGDLRGHLRYHPNGGEPKMLADAGVPRQLFPPPELIDEEEVDGWLLLVEGEPDAVRAWSLGLLAVAVPGAQNWQDGWAARFTGRHWRIAVCFDCDQAGRLGAVRVAGSLALAGLEVRLVDLDESRDDGFDLTDLAGDALTFTERAAMKDRLLELAEWVEPYQPSTADALRHRLAEMHQPTPTVGDTAEPDQEEQEPVEFVTVPITEFASVEEPEAEALVTSSNGGSAMQTGGLGLMYGKDGANKTTLTIDWVVHLGRGEGWHGLLHPARRLHCLIVENEGPRANFRTKLRKRLTAEPDGGADLEKFIDVLVEPWAEVDLRKETHRQALAERIAAQQIDLMVIGPLFALGMVGAGTADEVTAFLVNLKDLRTRAGRPLFILIVHHENKGGDVSGAWGPRPDLMILVQPAEPKHVRLTWRKAKWASELHGQSVHLKWAEEEDGTFEVTERQGQATDEEIWEGIAAYVLAHGGTGWGAVSKSEGVKGDDHTKRKVRDRMLGPGGPLVNLGKQRKDGSWNYKLWHREDETAPPEVEWVATRPATQLDRDSGSGAEGPSRVAGGSGGNPPTHSTWNPSSELGEEPPDPDDPDSDIPF